MNIGSLVLNFSEANMLHYTCFKLVGTPHGRIGGWVYPAPLKLFYFHPPCPHLRGFDYADRCWNLSI